MALNLALLWSFFFLKEKKKKKKHKTFIIGSVPSISTSTPQIHFYKYNFYIHYFFPLINRAHKPSISHQVIINLLPGIKHLGCVLSPSVFFLLYHSNDRQKINLAGPVTMTVNPLRYMVKYTVLYTSPSLPSCDLVLFCLFDEGLLGL